MPFDTTTLDSPFTALAAFDWGGDAAPLGVIDAAVVAAHGDAALTANLEKRLGSIISGASSRAAKDYACRKLSMIGTAASVPALAPLLTDPDESHMARFALERIPAPAAADALRQALGKVRGDLVVGMISSLANRRDTASVKPLAALLAGDAKIAAAAASALGRIATAEAAATLAAAKVQPGPVADAVVDARLACADALLAAGDRGAARAIYEAVAAGVGDAPTTRRGRALRMAARSGILAALDDTVGQAIRRGFMAAWLALTLLVPMAHAEPVAPAPSATAKQAAESVLAAIAGGDADLRAVALERVRYGLHGTWFTEALVAKLPALDPRRQVEVLSALADRGDIAAVAAASSLIKSSGDADVRLAATRVLGKLGRGADVPALVAALAGEGAMPAAARRALVDLSGPDAATAIRKAAETASASSRATILDIVAERRDRGAVPLLVAAAGDDDAAIRQAAMRGLAAFGGPNEIPAMVASLMKSSGDERKAAELAIVKVCTSSRDAEAAASSALASYEAADEASRQALLPALARIGGPKVMAMIDAMLADPAKRPQGLDALSRWPDATVKDRLLELFGKATEPKEKDLLLGTLIRIAPLPDNKLDDGQKLDLLVKTMALCQRNEDKAKVLERANAIRTIETFRFVAPYVDDPALAESACGSVVELAHHQKLRDAHKEEFTKALDKVLGITKNDELIERATRYKAGQTWNRQKKS